MVHRSATIEKDPVVFKNNLCLRLAPFLFNWKVLSIEKSVVLKTEHNIKYILILTINGKPAHVRSIPRRISFFLGPFKIPTIVHLNNKL